MKINDKELFSTEFIDIYAKKGFGSMNKSDFETMIFNLLRKYGNLKDKSNYEISIELQIPEAKVRKLAYESDLKYAQLTEEKIRIEFFNIVAKSKFRGDLNKVEFVIENKFIRTSISAQLKKIGHYSDSSFNSEIIRIHIDSFIDLLEYYYPDKAVEKILKDCKDSVKKDKDSTEITFKSILKKFIDGISTQAGKKTVDLGVAYFTGGIENVSPLIKSIKKMINGG